MEGAQSNPAWPCASAPRDAQGSLVPGRAVCGAAHGAVPVEPAPGQRFLSLSWCWARTRREGARSAPVPCPRPHMEAPAQDGAEAPLERCPEAEGPRGQPGSPSPPPAGRWSGAEVGSWLAAHGGSGGLAELAREHALTGRALLRLTEGSLRRMGVTPRSRRRELLRELLRLRLQQEIQELRSIAGEGR
ncbi:sterile alpha motif domain-containing protein 12-like isoform X1 [Corvus kubaryi]|uniref:sterile alpha motif domain-containing protein 12-like n=1 Tax=Corvus moneduloides TaxID=1196302 RepID=UPI00136296F8|nr:sterile alpha motif domain-containing protein 12-like [Corvus moneduloides]XP_041885414.1 sterile alpha motif domain-containing protein 12-like isoform X1 [Corvus kubaryi]